MAPFIDLVETLKDSPKFRCTLEENVHNIESLEHKLERVVKHCSAMKECGESYVRSQDAFISSLWNLGEHYKDDASMYAMIAKLCQMFGEMIQFHRILIDQSDRTISQGFTRFIREKVRPFRETKSSFDKVSTELDNVLVRHSSCQKSKLMECQETSNTLLATRTCYRHTGLDLVYSISVAKAAAKHHILNTLRSYALAYNTYFHQGTDICEDMDPFIKDISEKIGHYRQEHDDMDKQLADRHNLVTGDDVIENGKESDGVHMSGYLFKRTSNAFKTWNRRWFTLHDKQLVYRKRTGDDTPTVMEEDLKLCSVRPALDIDRRFCFELLSPNRFHMLQADSEEMYHMWISKVSNSIRNQLQAGTLSKSTQDDNSVQQNNPSQAIKKIRIGEKLRKIPGNEFCCDCGAGDPSWASINLGITLCIECSGIHRSLGVHTSRVRSLDLDAWEPGIINVFRELGNTTVNKIYEANVSKTRVNRASPTSERAIREAWIRAKYVEKHFVKNIANEHKQKGIVRRWSVKQVRRRARSNDAREDVVSTSHISCSSDASIQSTPLPANPIAKPPRVAHTMDPEEIGISGRDPRKTKSVSPPPSQPQETVNQAKRHSDVLVIGDHLEQSEEESRDTGAVSESESVEGDDKPNSEDLSKLDANHLLFHAASAHNLPVMCEALAAGADKHWHNPGSSNQTALHQAVLSGSVMACEYLLLNGTKSDLPDGNMQTPMHLAASRSHTAQVLLLLKFRADFSLKDSEGMTSLDIALANANADNRTHANADIVTLLRLCVLKEEMRDVDPDSPTDNTFDDVFRDFCQMASVSPEKLLRDSSSSSLASSQSCNS